MTAVAIGTKYILELWKDELIKSTRNPQPDPRAVITLSPDNQFYFHVH